MHDVSMANTKPPHLVQRAPAVTVVADCRNELNGGA
jgi:hypothetical protein